MPIAILLTVMLAQAAAGAAIAQTRPADPVTDAVRRMFNEHRKNIAGAFAAMPEDEYSFKPTTELMTFGELAVHIGSAHVYYCRRLGAPAPAFPQPKGTAAKTDLVQYLEQTLEFCAPIVAQARDASLADPAQVASGSAPTRAAVLIQLVSGMDHHYGQAAGYLRLNGVLPPTAQPGKQ